MVGQHNSQSESRRIFLYSNCDLERNIYWNGAGWFYWTSNYSTAFELYGINDTFFTLQPNSLEPLVTRNSRAPFRFYEKSVYPDEVDALFHFEASPFDISAIYNCTRANTVVAFEAIRGNPNIDRLVSAEIGCILVLV